MDVQLFTERVNAVAEFGRLVRELEGTVRVLIACDSVGDSEVTRDFLLREKAEIEGKLKACGERILQLAAAVEPADDDTEFDNAVVKAHLMQLALKQQLSTTQDPGDRAKIEQYLVELAKLVAEGEALRKATAH
jgi:hypothetical protein